MGNGKTGRPSFPNLEHFNKIMKYTTGDLLELFDNDEVQCVLHVANCQGVMGSGIALQIKEQFPQAYTAYKKDEQRNNGLILGSYSMAAIREEACIVNLHAQDFYGVGSRQLNYEALYNSLEQVAQTLKFANFTGVIGVPEKMGSDRAGGNWEIVEKIVEVTMKDFDVLIVSYDGNDNR